MKKVRKASQIKLKNSNTVIRPKERNLNPIDRPRVFKVNPEALKNKQPGVSLDDYVLDLMKLQ